MDQQPKVGDHVRYGGTGICLVERVEKMPFPDELHMRLCCELKPVGNPAMAILVPLDNETLCAKMQPLLSEDEVKSLLETVPAMPSLWIEERKQRATEYRRILSTGDAQTLLQLLRTFEVQQETLRAAKKKLAAADLAVWKEATRIVTEEVAYSLGISREEATTYIQPALQCTAEA